MFDPSRNPWRVEYDVVDGIIEQVANVPPYVWAPFNSETGEVELDHPHQFGDDLHELHAPWVWKKFNMVLAND